MPSRQDQLHSYQFTVHRVVAALVMRDTDPAQSPFRRAGGAVLVGVLLAALVFGGAAAYGVLSPGGSGRWRDERVVIVERESGAIFVYRDERLHPVLNYASALLVLNTPGAKSVAVSRASLAGVPRGVAWGIAGAPASLPPKSSLVRGGWTVCTDRGRSVLFVGPGPAGADLGAKALVVSTSDGTFYALLSGHKHLVRQPQVLARLLWNKDPLEVAPAFLNALPAGADLAWPALDGRGRAAPLPGLKVGQLVKVGKEAFVALADGLASITPFQSEIMLSDPSTTVVEWSPGDFARLTQGQVVRAFDRGGLPAEVPARAEKPSGAVCFGAAITVDALLPDLSGTGGLLPDLSGAGVTRPGSSGTVVADRVVVPPGAGAVVTSTAGGLSLITDSGLRYSVPSGQLLPVLGYAGAPVTSLPAEVLALVPAGPALDPAAVFG